MALTGYLQDGLRILILDREAVDRLARDRDSFGIGLLIVLLAGLALGLWGTITRLQWLGLFLDPIAVALCFVATVYLVHITAMLLGGEGSFLELLRPASCAFVIGWALLLPWIGVPLLLWYLVALACCVSEIHHAPFSRGILAVAIPILLVLILILATIGAKSLIA